MTQKQKLSSNLLNILVLLPGICSLNLIMASTKADIIAQLQREILPLQGFKALTGNPLIDINLGPIKKAFPNNTFPIGAVHEFISTSVENAAASKGFIGSILASLMQKGGASIWISPHRTIFPPALQSFHIAPEKIIFIDLKKEKQMLWVMEEALKCEGLAAVIGEIPELSFTASRRLQLAVEQSQVTGFVLRHNPKSINKTACVTRWQISSLPSQLLNDMPGVGFPRWNVELLKVRNGKPGSWEIEFAGGKFKPVSKITAVNVQAQKKTG